MSDNPAAPLRGCSVVITEKSTEPLPPMNRTADALLERTIDQLVVDPLVIPFAMVVCDEIGERPPKMPFTERDHAIQALLSDRAHKSLCMGIAVRRQDRRPNNPDACRREEALDGGAPLSIAIADQHTVRAEHAVDIIGQVTHRLDDERFVRMPR